MAITVMNDNNINIPAKMDASVYNIGCGFAPHTFSKNYGLSGRTYDFEVRNTSGLKVAVTAGAVSVYGYTIMSDSGISLEIPPNATGYVCVTLDLTQPAGQEARAEFVTTLKQENILANGKIYNVPLAKIITNGTSITTNEDLRFKEELEKGGVYLSKVGGNNVELKSTTTEQTLAVNYEAQTEYFTGKLFFDGRKIYEQVFTFNGASFKPDSWEFSPAIVGADAPTVRIVDSTYRTKDAVYTIPYYESGEIYINTFFQRSTNKVAVRAGKKIAAGACIVKVQYCKVGE